jgi:hypothetical protein
VTAVHLFYPKTTVTADVHEALAASLELNLRLEAKLREVTADAMRLAEERDDLKARVASMMESMSMSCENPPTGCDCAGCSYAQEKGGDV